MTRHSTFDRPRASAPRNRAASIIRGDTSVEIEVLLGADTLGDEEAGLSGSGRKFEDRPARSGPDLVDEPVGDNARSWRELLAVAFPGRRDGVAISVASGPSDSDARHTLTRTAGC